jgi:hypothetical protein
VSSSPLILGADLSDAALLQKIAPIITNAEAIAINQVCLSKSGGNRNWFRVPPVSSGNRCFAKPGSGQTY